jgi:hypothetical protein
MCVRDGELGETIAPQRRIERLLLNETPEIRRTKFQACGSAEVAIPPRCRDLPDGGAMLVFAGELCSVLRSRLCCVACEARSSEAVMVSRAGSQ